MIAKVDPETCIGCTLCVATCPGVFQMKDDKAVVVVALVPVELHVLCRKAAEDCPAQAIEVKEE